jgi:DNA-binding XRE family transcriptional regulator
MKTSYCKRDYTYGATMLTLRTAIGLTQEGLASLLGVSRRAVGDWEAGSSYPKTEHLKKMIVLAVKQQAFPRGNEAQEIRALWKTAHQKVLLDEHWLSSLLEQPHSPENTRRTNLPGKQTMKTEAEGQKELVVTPIYSTGWGRFALGSPSGEILYPGRSVEILLAGHRISGMIHAGALGDYFQPKDGKSCCGLCTGMYVIVS